ncbi:MAG TPA: PfkB family carbohydrate kinase [Thermoclostridium caenicola]|uniref:PfkB family carbohydrate kinase n=1 Tax=Thermoclostridium caenicola TaxID=659425 RepID=A0A1M6FH11_9FIRM|nr:PfkB family carbohydrate kinase [Thermoclostridium caenicola]SHI96919.1 pfkB family carbohydrate kinase [Thermoclostridium caenicola]HOK43436.1 PfkB family carbohydrate kinase [Thermoclostridium caenicola]HOL84121.1 PfkB family carbohydrate kinase [Thermoclostridium caenicola]HPO76194.1 PfkB family carbohydrate kinase [Thermoclostridium caenicola]
MERGISIAGTITVDYNKVIDRYAEKGMLSNILSCTRSVGGCVPNTLINLSRMDPAIPLYAYGGIGNDENGEFVLSVLKAHGIHTEGIKVFDGELTAFTDCMTVESTGERTFFFARGVSRRFSMEDMDFDAIETDMFHMGYALLMEPFDREEGEELCWSIYRQLWLMPKKIAARSQPSIPLIWKALWPSCRMLKLIRFR